MKKGEIWIVELFSTKGHEQEGFIVPCTSNIQALRFPHTIEVHPSKKNRLSVTSVALGFHLRAIDKIR